MKGLPIAISGLHVSYGDVKVLRGIDLEVGAGEFIALLGESGCGKTTLLRSIAGFVPVTGGEIRLGGASIAGLAPEKRNTAMMFQSYALWPHLNVAGNIGFALGLRGFSRADIRERVERMLDLVGLAGYGGRKVTELSGGQRQRIALARALAVDPPVLLLDEPLSNLDARIRHTMRHEIKSLQKSLGLTTILVTHDREEAMAMADRVVILDRGEIVQAGSPEEVYHRPASAFVAAFMGAENAYPVAMRADGADIIVAGQHIESEIRLPLADYPGRKGVNCPVPADGPSVARFRSEAAMLADVGKPVDGHLTLSGRVVQHSYLGNAYRHTVAVGDHHFLVDHPECIEAGTTVEICIPAAALHLFAQTGGRTATGPAGETSVPTH